MKRRSGVDAAGGEDGPGTPTRTVSSHRRPKGSRVDGSLGSGWTVSLLVGVLVLGVYWRTLHPSVPGGDSGELITAAHELGVAHPPGYPLFTLLARLAMSLASPGSPGSPAFRVNLLTAACAAGAAALLHAAVHRASGSVPAGVLAAGLFAFSRLTWHWAVAAEVFSLNNLLVALLVLLVACFGAAPDAPSRCKFAKAGAFVCGLSLSNQHTASLYVVCLVPWALHALLERKELGAASLLRLAACSAAGLLPHLYLPVSSHLGLARWTWGDQSSLHGFLTHLLRQEYGTFSLAKSGSGSGMLTMLSVQATHMHHELLGVGPLLAAALFPLLVKHRSRERDALPPLLLALMLAVYSLVFAWRANLDVSTPLLLGVVERFWLQSNLVVCVLAGLAAARLGALARALLGHGRPLAACEWLLVACCVLLQLRRNCSVCDQSSNVVVEQFGANILRSLPRGALVLTRGDLPGNALRYLHYCERRRPDVVLVDQELLTYPWYVRKLGPHLPGVRFPGDRWHPAEGLLPDGTLAFSMRSFLEENRGRPVFSCIGLSEEESSWRGAFERRPWGVCEQLVPAGTPLRAHELAEATTGIYNWTFPYHGFDPTSWDHVANEEMWQSRIKTPFYLFEVAEDERLPRETRVALYALSYQLYRPLVSGEEEPLPLNWHKNFALACERLLRVGGAGEAAPPAVPAERLLREAIAHLRRYVEGAVVERGQEDPQLESVRRLARHLAEELARLQRGAAMALGGGGGAAGGAGGSA
uniref:Transmembrane protein 260 isoform X1 n=2 Tax=Petromyzon marinus TaxID=7757 RepID=A0AAJ7T634_PETMA|nr:transmembrane protein 260 isoform X1 [Petromyzon marinus]XP_032811931.1 transmembrane protein 260 isoform X1 [Petromyzon marinus]XP_032811932.1 transmembrane protein 260 isoform X1 [Petromyzon marinus]XP_032811933.1 transmembrane protein 260 isoform X1 [Petromyzon marinus]XP_032811934.1 transmembrane protein 260 isoform X1 [Petromyzon marinus]